MNHIRTGLSLALALSLGCASSKPVSGFDEDQPDSSVLDRDSSEGGGHRDDIDATLGGGLLENDAGSGSAGPSDGSIYNDASLDVNAGDACMVGEAGAPPHPQKCTPAVLNECDGPTDNSLTGIGVIGGLLNGQGGNGFDDDCDGLVDEGCKCGSNGQTKDCYLVPASQADTASKKAVGWCADNAKGSLDCAGTEFPKWSGTCRGAQPPYRHDVCAMGDFNCDGLDQNSDVQDCACKVEPVTCPTTPITVAPYPTPNAIPIVDGSQWVTSPAARATTTNWTWTVIGGDCDNVLPHPTYAVYNQANSTVAGARKGTRTGVKYDTTLTPARYIVAPSEPLMAIRADNYGNGVAGGQIHPAFGLSGDYIVQGEWDLDGTHYVCTQKVQVRAPGIRAELCWDTVGGAPFPGGQGNDIDLHFARLQGVTCPAKGWETSCPEGSTYQDCWYSSGSGCRDGSPTGPNWGYTDSVQASCVGWSSRRHAKNGILYTQGCTNPRLDKDNITCDRAIDDPAADGTAFGSTGEFCGPENINLDNPNDNDGFIVGVNHFGNHNGTSNAKPHVNLYCNGVRVLSAGYNPVTGQTGFPMLTTGGADSGGDLWNVATIKAHVTGGQLTSCDVAGIPSHHADPTRDGPAAQAPPNDTAQACVDSKSNATPAPNQYNYTSHAMVDHAVLQGGANGDMPASAAAFCKH